MHLKFAQNVDGIKIAVIRVVVHNDPGRGLITQDYG